MVEQMSRRDFLKRSTAAAAGAVLASCAPLPKGREKEVQNRLPRFIKPVVELQDRKDDLVLRLGEDFFLPQFDREFEIIESRDLGTLGELQVLAGNCFNNDGDPLAILAFKLGDLAAINSVKVSVIEDSESEEADKRIVKSETTLNRGELEAVRSHGDPKKNLEPKAVQEELAAHLFVVPDEEIAAQSANAVSFTARLPGLKKVWHIPGTAAREGREMRNPAIKIVLTTKTQEKIPLEFPLTFPLPGELPS